MCLSLARRWVPKTSLSQALSVAYSGGPVGIITALLAAPAIIRTLGWESVFWIFGTTGLLWMFAWMPLVDEEPPQLVEDVKKDRSAAGALPAWSITLSIGRAAKTVQQDRMITML
jgi:predicted MFS family arabinose efflux permease